jgi:hypothetical protein
VAPGVVLIDVLEAGRPEHYRQYEVRPTAGSVRQMKEATFQGAAQEDIPHAFDESSGSIEACARNPLATSADKSYQAYCANSESDEFFVADSKTSETIFHWKPETPRRIRGFAWSPNSHSVALLSVSSYLGKSPMELLSALSGHPVPHDTVFLDFVDVRARKITEYVIRRDVPSSFVRILSWSD